MARFRDNIRRGSYMSDTKRARTGIVVFNSTVAVIFVVAAFVSVNNAHPWLAVACLVIALLWAYRAFRWSRADQDEALGANRRYRLLGP